MIERIGILLLLACLGCTASEPKKPNVLFIVVDDLGYHDLSVTGSSYYETPNIDSLAGLSARFSNGYATCAVCSPSRASLLTGKFPATHGITDWIGSPSGVDWRKKNRHTILLPADYKHRLDPDFITLPEAFKEVGYSTFFAGKWHLGSEEDHSFPTDHGFDINIGGNHRGSPSGGFFSPFKNPQLPDREEEKGMSLSMRLANETSRFIEEHKDSTFLAYLSFYAVHAPIQTTESKWRKYRNKADSMGIAAQGFEMERVLPIRVHQDNPVYAGLVEQVDDAVGSVLATLQRLGLSENTIVVFTSDNGGVASGDNFSTSNLPLRGGKGYQWEGGTKVPLFIKYPSGGKGQSIEVPVTGADLYPTLLDLAGIPLKPSEHTDGVSLLPLIKGHLIEDRLLYWHYPHYGNQGGEPHSIVRDGDWKLIHYWEDGRDELYNLGSDIAEKDNVLSANQERVTVLREKLMTWLESRNAQYPEKDTEYDPEASEKVLKRFEARKTSLEEGRAKMLQPNWKPNQNWWGSDRADEVTE